MLKQIEEALFQDNRIDCVNVTFYFFHKKRNEIIQERRNMCSGSAGPKSLIMYFRFTEFRLKPYCLVSSVSPKW